MLAEIKGHQSKYVMVFNFVSLHSEFSSSLSLKSIPKLHGNSVSFFLPLGKKLIKFYQKRSILKFLWK